MTALSPGKASGRGPAAAPRRGESALFGYSLAASLLLHASIWMIGRGWPSGELAPAQPVEIDLTKPLGTGPAHLGAPKRLVPQARGKPLPQHEPVNPEAPPSAPQTPKDWVLQGEETKKVEEPQAPAPTPGGAPEGTGTAAKTGGWGEGADDGVPGGTGTGGSGGELVAYPRLLNRAEVLSNLQRRYPEAERRAGREGRVLVTVQVGADGLVAGVEIAESGGAAFDQAAAQVARLMRFEPARTPAGPVAVKIRQAMVFRLE